MAWTLSFYNSSLPAFGRFKLSLPLGSLSNNLRSKYVHFSIFLGKNFTIEVTGKIFLIFSISCLYLLYSIYCVCQGVFHCVCSSFLHVLLISLGQVCLFPEVLGDLLCITLKYMIKLLYVSLIYCLNLFKTK